MIPPQIKKINIVIPVHNEEELLLNAIGGFIYSIRNYFSIQENFLIELILVENGSNDNTLALCSQLAERHKEIQIIKLDYQDYGRALKKGILSCTGDYIFTLDLDLCDINFISESIKLLEKFDIVVSSKLNEFSKDKRPVLRRIITRFFNLFIRYIFGYNSSTDTHGPKAYRRNSIIPVVEKCKSNNSMFDTEIMLRAEKGKLKISEVPINVKEIRETRFNNFERFFSFFKDILVLICDTYFIPVCMKVNPVRIISNRVNQFIKTVL